MNIDILPFRIEHGDYTAYLESTSGQFVFRIYRNGNDTPVATGSGCKRDLVGEAAARKLQALAKAQQ